MCLDLVDHVCKNPELFEKLRISPEIGHLIINSWNRKDPSIYGRFDLSYDGVNPPKMLEYNADTPTSLLESAVIQWKWLEDQSSQLKNEDQFNSIHEKLIEAWKKHPADKIHFASVTDMTEDYRTTEYMLDCALQAGKEVVFLDIENVGHDGERFVDENEEPIDYLFKLYPWEWMVNEGFAENLQDESTLFVEPIWKLILSNKAMLPLLWELFPNHPNLLECSFESLDKPHVKKPIFGREGSGVEIIHPDVEKSVVDSPYGAEGFIYQEFAPLPSFGKSHALIGSWVVDNVSCGMCIREEDTLVTGNTSRFVPHYFH